MGKKRHIGKTDDFERYRRGSMSNRERHTYEKRLQGDPFEAEAAEGLSMLSDAQIEDDMQTLNRRMEKRTKSRKRTAFVYWAAAASILLLVVSSLFIFRLNKDEQEKTVSDSRIEKTDSEKEADNQTLSKETAQPISLPGKEKEKAEKGTPGEKKVQQKSPEKKAAPIAVPEREDMVITNEDESVVIPENQTVDEEIIVEELLFEEDAQDTYEIKPVEKQKADIQSRRNRAVSVVKDTQTVPVRIRGAQTISGKQSKEREFLTLKGKIVDATDSFPLPGVSVMQKGTSLGVVSDINGNFSLQYDGGKDPTFMASFIGMEQREFTPVVDSPFVLALEPSELALEEAVVVGAGVKRERHTTGSVTTIAMDDELNAYDSSQPRQGWQAFKKFVKANIRYPGGIENPKREVVRLSFTIKPNGTMHDLKVVKSPGDAFTKEAIRLVESIPGWIPASRGGEVVEERVRLRIIFKPGTD